MLAKLKKIYDEKYKVLLVIPIAILVASVLILVAEKYQTGEYIDKDITLKGGTLVTVQTDQIIDARAVEDHLADILDVSTRVKEISSITGGRIGYTFEAEQTSNLDELLQAITEASGIELVEDQYTVEEISSSLSSTFWSSTIRAIILAFVFMAIVVFLYFRKVVPSLAIILAAVSNLIGVLAIMNLIGLKLSTAGVAALLMILGYSVDTDILLSTRMLKRTDLDKEERLYGALKTGLTMSVTTLVAMSVVWLLTPALVLKQITLILIFGLLLDLINTWIQNAGLLRWYMEKKA